MFKNGTMSQSILAIDNSEIADNLIVHEYE